MALDCPFCGSSWLDYHTVRTSFAIKCTNCEAHGPLLATKPEAVRAWNARADNKKTKDNREACIPVPRFTAGGLEVTFEDLAKAETMALLLLNLGISYVKSGVKIKTKLSEAQAKELETIWTLIGEMRHD